MIKLRPWAKKSSFRHKHLRLSNWRECKGVEPSAHAEGRTPAELKSVRPTGTHPPPHHFVNTKRLSRSHGFWNFIQIRDDSDYRSVRRESTRSTRSASANPPSNSRPGREGGIRSNKNTRKKPRKRLLCHFRGSLRSVMPRRSGLRRVVPAARSSGLLQRSVRPALRP